jgi:hypothetical protein
MKPIQIIALLGIPFLLSACASSMDATQAIEGYIRALTEKDVISATGASCLEWEESAYAEASSFEAVEVTLEGLDCEPLAVEGEYTLVHCEGIIVANYGGELQDIELSQRTYLALKEQGEWKMCGYASN